MWLPKSAVIQFASKTEGTLPQRSFLVRVPGVMEMSFVVESRGSPGLAILPPEVVAGSDIVEHLTTYGIEVRMHARFDWSSAKNPAMPGYKEWASFLFFNIEQLNSDDPSDQPVVAKPVGG